MYWLWQLVTVIGGGPVTPPYKYFIKTKKQLFSTAERTFMTHDISLSTI